MRWRVTMVKEGQGGRALPLWVRHHGLPGIWRPLRGLGIRWNQFARGSDDLPRCVGLLVPRQFVKLHKEAARPVPLQLQPARAAFPLAGLP